MVWAPVARGWAMAEEGGVVVRWGEVAVESDGCAVLTGDSANFNGQKVERHDSHFVF